MRGVEAIKAALCAAHSHVTCIYKTLHEHMDLWQGAAEGKWKDWCRQVEGLLMACAETVKASRGIAEGKWRFEGSGDC